MKKEIKFNSLFASNAYVKNFELIMSDYELFRKKHFSNSCINLLKKTYLQSELFLTHSATGALEMIALALDIQEGDEIILPSFTFVSTANAFALRGAKLVFVDIEMETLGIDPFWVEKAITPKTKAIVAVHYAGNPCKIKELKEIATKNSLFLIEDAAMAFGSNYEGQPLGTIGDFGVVSFDITKQIVAIQGGLLLVNNLKFKSRINKIYHLGTNRMEFQQGEVPYYEWVDLGSKFQMNELNAAVLDCQLKENSKIVSKRKLLSSLYYNKLKELENLGKIKLIPQKYVQENVHEFYIILKNIKERDSLSAFLKINQIETLFHYIPLHLSPMGVKIGCFKGKLNTVQVSEKILRLPFHHNISKKEVSVVCELIYNFFIK